MTRNSQDKKKYKICIATGLYPPDIGGPATYTKMLEDVLPPRGFELVVVPYGLVRHYPPILRHLAYALKLLISGRAADLYHTLDPVSVGVPTYLAHVLSRKPYLIRIAGDYAWEQGQQRYGVTETLDEFLESDRPFPFFVRVLRYAQSFVTRHALHVIVPSEYMRRVVLEWDVAASNVTRIYSALHPLVVSEERKSIRSMFEYHGCVLVTAARLVPWKGIGTLIALLPVLRERLGDVLLIVVGDGPLEETLKEESRQRGVSDHVRFVGRMPKDTLGAVIKGGDVFILNTSYEGMSHQLIEVMDLGVPIVATEVGGNPELITSGLDGVLVPYDNTEALAAAVVRIVRDEAFRNQLITHGRLRAKAFRRETVVAKLAELLTRLMP